MKHEVAKDLPKKTEKIIDEQMPSLQAGSYHEVITSAKSGHAGKSKLEMIHQMRSISLHPNYGKFEKEDSGDNFIGDSARLKVMVEILESIHAKSEKVLIFIESLAMQEWLAYFLKEHFNLPKYPLRIYGNTSADKRTKIVAQFQSDENKGFDVLLLSPKAAGVGLTLTAATNVIHLTRWWNPAVEDQCTDRVYRIGQDKEVTVFIPRAIHPLYGNESFDCLLHEILENKRALSREMLVPMESAGDIDYIFGKSTS
jgi:SNF2 family DNA or RNA helicase